MGRCQGSQQPAEARPVVRRGSAALRIRRDYLEIFDIEHSELEERFIAIGPIDRGIVVVVYTEREEHLIRIIGARLANKREQALYRSYRDRYK